MSDRERRSIDPITAELCVWTCCFKNKTVNHLFPFILFSLTSTYMHYRNLSKEREEEKFLLLYLTVILNIVHIKRDFNCDDALFELFCTSDVFHKSLLIVHCYKIVCIYFKLWSEIFFYTFLYLLKNYWFTYFRNVDLLKHFLRQ